MISYALVDESSAPELKSGAMVTMKRDLQCAYDEHFAPTCGVLPVDIQFRHASEVLPTDRVMHLVDELDDAGALAYHTVDDQGRPVLRLGVNAIREAGGNLLDAISDALSHEIFETARNPYCNRYLQAPSGPDVADEACDPVQGTGFRVGASLIANFTLPAWSDADDHDGPYDYVTLLGHERILSAPFECYPTGYLAFRDGSQHFGEKMSDERAYHAEHFGKFAAKKEE